VTVAVRLVQRIDESMEYTMIDEPRPVSLGSRIPVTYHNIQGAYGVDNGEVQVYNVNSGEVYGSFGIEFFARD
jgi:serine/threonine-protein kinase